MPIRCLSFYACACAVTAGILLVFYSDVAIDLPPLYMWEIVCMDVLAILCWYWLSPRRMGVPVVCMVWLLALFLGANSLYYSYWGSLLSVHTIFSASSYNIFVGQAVAKLITLKTMLYIILPSLLTFCYVVTKRSCINDCHVPVGMKATIISLSIILFFAASFMRLRRYSIYLSDIGLTENLYTTALRHRYASFGKPSGLDALSMQGITVYTLSQSIAALRPQYIDLSSDDRRLIDKFIAETPAGSAVLESNHDKNLILIIVESLNADYIGRKIDGENVTPVLSSLIDRDGTVSSLNMVVQIREGGSSDGQMIYNTGLLPLKIGSAAIMYGDNEFPSIAKAFPDRMSIEVIPEHKKVWNHGMTSVSYGYKRLYDAKDLENAGHDVISRGADGALFDYAMSLVNTLPEPFVCTIPTISMHYPFDNPGVPDYGFKDVSNRTEVAYLNALHYFDLELGKFLKALDAAGILDKSVVVIASDHDMCTDDPQMWSRGLRVHPAAFIALNTGVTKQIGHVTSQADLFPTVMDVMGVSDYGWRGVGFSMLDPGHPGGGVDSSGKLHGNFNRRNLDAAEVSDLIIRSNYFKNRLKNE